MPFMSGGVDDEGEPVRSFDPPACPSGRQQTFVFLHGDQYLSAQRGTLLATMFRVDDQVEPFTSENAHVRVTALHPSKELGTVADTQWSRPGTINAFRS